MASAGGQQIKKTVLELGGSDPFIVMPSADLERAVRTAVKARTINNGQSCIAAKRFIVADAIADEFERRFVAAMEALQVGDPMDETTEVGPLATADILEGLDEQVRRSRGAGARVLTGGRRLDGPGNYYAPTVLTDIPPDSPAYREELFGPVAALFRVRRHRRGDPARQRHPVRPGQQRLDERRGGAASASSRRSKPGMVFVNGMVASDPRLPFGGVKRSGYGRELGAYGIREFVNVKTVRCDVAGALYAAARKKRRRIQAEAGREEQNVHQDHRSSGLGIAETLSAKYSAQSGRSGRRPCPTA